MPDLHVILTLDTRGMKGECYQARAVTRSRGRGQHGKGRVFYTADGRPARKNWEE